MKLQNQLHQPRNQGAIRLSLSKQDLAILQRAGDIFGDKIMRARGLSMFK